jgi:hypothetical protein
MDAESAIDRPFRDGPAEADWFAPGLLDQVPLSTVRQLVGGLKDRFGPLREVSRAGGRLQGRLRAGRPQPVDPACRPGWHDALRRRDLE